MNNPDAVLIDLLYFLGTLPTQLLDKPDDTATDTTGTSALNNQLLQLERGSYGIPAEYANKLRSHVLHDIEHDLKGTLGSCLNIDAYRCSLSIEDGISCIKKLPHGEECGCEVANIHRS